MPRPRNEGKVCDAVIRDLERRANLGRSDLTRPEITGIGPPVDFEFALGPTRYALEHTELQSFPGQIRQGVNFQQLAEGPIEALSGQLPTPGVYYLTLPTNTRVGTAALDSVRSCLANWMVAQAVAWREAKPLKRDKRHAPSGDGDHVETKPPGVPFAVHFERELPSAQSDRSDGMLFTSRLAPRNMKEARGRSLASSLDKKLPKLAKCRRNGRRTILVLEETDISLSNFSIVTSTLATTPKKRRNMPDEIYLVSTFEFLEAWPVRLLFRDAAFRDQDDIRLDRSEFAPSDLVDLAATA